MFWENAYIEHSVYAPTICLHLNRTYLIGVRYVMGLIPKSEEGKNTLYSIIHLTPLTHLKYHVFENIMENGAFAPKGQMLNFP